MKATGIVRRIDELGRVVIPKEIRRTLRIREGYPLEIYTNSVGEIILKKYSPIGEMGDCAQDYADVLSRVSGFSVIIGDRDVVVAVGGNQKKTYMDKSLHPQLEMAMEGRKTQQLSKEAGNIVPIIEDGTSEFAAQTVTPVISDGEIIGVVVLASGEEMVMGETERKLSETAAMFLGRQLES